MFEPTNLIRTVKALIVLSVLGMVSHLAALANTRWMKGVGLPLHFGLWEQCEKVPDAGEECSKVTEIYKGLVRSDFRAMQALGILSLFAGMTGLVFRIMALQRIQTPLWRIMAFVCALLEALLSVTLLSLLRSEFGGESVQFDKGIAAPISVIAISLLVTFISFFTFGSGLQTCVNSREPDCAGPSTHMPFVPAYQQGGAIPSGYQQNYGGFEGATPPQQQFSGGQHPGSPLVEHR